MDADGPLAIKNDLIGAYSFDAANVYFHKVSVCPIRVSTIDILLIFYYIIY